MSEGRYRLQGRHQDSRILPDGVSAFAQCFIFGHITGNLKLWTNSQGSAGSLCLPDTFNDPVSITLPIEGPLVQVAVLSSQRHMVR